MLKQFRPKKLFLLTTLWLLLVLSVFASFAGLLGHSDRYKVEAATSSTINFQARLLTSAGALVPDGYYNVEFKLYSVSSGGTAQWTETYYDSNGVTAGNDNRARVVNGYLSVYLGSLTSFPSINWDQQEWVSLNIGGTTQTATPTWDGEMSPRLQLTAVPYAFRAGQLAKLTGANTSTLDFATQTGARSILLPDESGTLCIQSSTNCGFAAGSGDADYIQNGTSLQASSNFHISGDGTADTSFTTPILQSAAATALLVDSGTTGALNIGTGANAKTITIGNGTGATSLVLNAGTGAINIGTNAVAHTTTIGNGTGASSVVIQSGTGAINIGTNAVAHTTTIGNGTGASSVVIQSGTGAINIGTNAVAHTTTVGSLTGAATTTVQGGTGGVSLGTGGIANTIQIGNTTGAVAQILNIGTNATASSTNTVNIGSQIGTSPLTLNSGTGNITLSPVGSSNSGVIVKPASSDSTKAFQVQYQDSTPLFTVDTTNGEVGIGTAGPLSGNELYVLSNSDTVIRGKNTGTADLLQLANATSDVLVLNNAGQLQLSTQGSTGGLQLGGDTLLYRSAANIISLGSNDSLAIPGGDLSVDGGDLTTAATTFNLLAGASTAINLGPASTTAVSINLAGGGSDTGCTVAGATGNLTCSGAIATNATTGTQGWWTRSGTTLSPVNSGDAITTTGNISTTSSGTLSIAGTSTLTGNVGIGTAPGSFEGLVVAKTYGSATATESYSQRITTTYSIADTGTKQGLRLNTNATNTTGTQASLVGLLALNSSNGNGGTTTDSTALWTRNDAATGATIQSAYGLKVVDGTGAGTINNQYGVYVNSLTKGGTNNYAIYTAGSTPSLFGGIINANATGKTAIQIADSGAQNSGITIGGDTNLYRSAANYLWSDDKIGASDSIGSNQYLWVSVNADNMLYLNHTGATSKKAQIVFQDDGTNTWQIGADINGTGAQTFDLYDSAAGSTRLSVNSNGQLQLPIQGSNAGLLIGGDAQIYRTAADMFGLGNGDSLRAYSSGGSQFLTLQSAATSVYMDARNSGASDWVLVTKLATGDTQQRYILKTSGEMQWGSGTAVPDIILTRSGAGALNLQPTASNNSTHALRIQDASGNPIFAVDNTVSTGRVGIGDDTPGASLEIRRPDQTTENAIRLSTTSNNDWKIYQPTSSSELRLWNDYVNTDVATFGLDGNVTLQTPSTDNVNAFLVKDSSGGTAFTVDTTRDNIAVGAAATNAKIYAQSGAYTVLRGNATGTNSLVELQNAGNNVLQVGNTGNVIAGGSSTGTTKTTEATARTSVTTVTLTSAGFANNDVIRLVRSGTYYYTRIVSGGGTTSLTVSPAVSYDASSTVTKYNVQYLGNDGSTFTGTTRSDNSYFQGYFTGGIVTGTGSTIYSDANISSTNDLKIQVASSVNVQNSSDSASAFHIQNAAGTDILNVDTSNKAITITGATSGSNSQTFNYTGSTQTFTVPAGVTSINVTLYGAGGGSGGQGNTASTGGQTTGTLAVTPGQVLTIYVGGAGGNGTAAGVGGAAGYNGGGAGGNAYNSSYPGGGGGGGASMIKDGATLKAAAGGGGGGAGWGSGSTAVGGNGGGTSGNAGSSSRPGGGGTQSAGGAGYGGGSSTYCGTPATSGSAGQGGTGGIGTGGPFSGASGSGGGGGGYYGGGGGDCGTGSGNGGGGGGSGYSAALTGASMTTGGNSGNGQVSITWTQPAFLVEDTSNNSYFSVDSTNSQVATFANTALFKNTSDNTTAFQIQNASGASLLLADTANSQLIVRATSTVSGGGANGGTGSGTTSDAGGGGGGAIGTVNAPSHSGGNGATGGQSVDVSGLFSVLSSVGGFPTTSPGAGNGNNGTYCVPQNGGNATGFGTGGGGANYYGGNGGNGLYGGGGGGASGGTGCPAYSGGTGGAGVVVISFSDGTNVVQTSGSSYTVPSGATSAKVWAIGAGGGGAGSPTGDSFSGGGGGAGAVVYRTFAVVAGQSITYSRGTGGTGGSGAANGGAGGSTTATYGGITITATGGSGGQYNNNGTGAGGSYSGYNTVVPLAVQDSSGNSLVSVNATTGGTTITGTNTGNYALQVTNAALGTTAGNVSALQQAGAWSSTSNNVQLSTYLLRTANGSDWTTTAIISQRITDVTGQGYLAYVGSNICINNYTCTHVLGVNGQGAASGGFITATPDIAEYITVSSGVKAADVVTADADHDEAVTTTSTPYDASVVGVIADGTSGFQMTNAHYGQPFDANTDATDPNAKPMTIAGRVPVKISGENGPVKPGDYLTTSSTPGYVMKATHAGATVGKALGTFNGSSINDKGTVLVLVNLDYYPGPTGQQYLQNGGDAEVANLNVSGSASLNNLEVSGSTHLNTLNVNGNTQINGDTTLENNASVGQNLTVSGDTTLQGNIAVTGITNLNGNLNAGQDFNVGGKTGLSSDLSVNGTTRLKSSLKVDGATQLQQATASSLDITGVATADSLTANVANINQIYSTNASITDLSVSGTATIGTLHVTGDSVFDGNLTVNAHIITGLLDQNAQLATEVTDAAGTDINGNQDAACTIDGNDTSGSIVLTTGSQGTSDGAVCKATFIAQFGSAPRSIIGPTDKDSAQLGAYVTTDTASFTLNFINAPEANHTYRFNYWNPQ